MRVLTLTRGLLVGTLAVGALALVATQSLAHPPSDPEHGLNETTFPPLWAGDEEAPNQTALRERVGENASQQRELAAGTDIPFESPPEAVEQWNRGDLADFPNTGPSESIHPPGASRTDGRFVADAYTSVFAVQPSTRARLSEDERPLYVAPNGTLLGTVDYRVDVPEDTRSRDRRVSWELEEHTIPETRLLVDGDREAQASGSKTPTLAYSDLDDLPDTTTTLALEADVSVTLRKTVRTCTERESTDDDDRDGECLNWETTTTHPSESITVSDNIDVTVYTLSVSGYRTSYPNGDLGLTVYKNQPWLGYASPDGEVRGVWWFYSSRDDDWDTLVSQTESSTSRTHSPVHPLQVSAYPTETGPTPAPHRNVSLLGTYGNATTPPTLPGNVELDVVEDPYTASFGIASRFRTSNHDIRRVKALGLVRGVETTLRPETFAEVPFHETSLSMTVQNTTAETTTVQISLREQETGTPIETQSRNGSIQFRGERVQTNASGMVTVTVEANGGGFSARYEPAQWWNQVPAYTGDSNVTYEGNSGFRLFGVLYEASIPVGMVLVCVFLIDRITGWEIWPPWGRY